jgi:hypothetical protein
VTRGFQPDPIREHAALVELAAALKAWQQAEQRTKNLAGARLRSGVRAQVLADALGMSRSTFYRWIGSRPTTRR